MTNKKLFLDEDTLKFLRNLKSLREKSGFTREQTAQIIGVTVDCLTRYECLHRPPSVKIFTQLAALFKYDISENINYKFYSGKIDYAKIRARIRSSGLTSSDLAKLTNYSEASINSVINKHDSSSIACLVAVLNILENKN